MGNCSEVCLCPIQGRRPTPDYQVHSDVNTDNCFAGPGGQILPSWMASSLRLLPHLGHTEERHLDHCYPSLQRTVRTPLSHGLMLSLFSHGTVGLHQSLNKYYLKSVQLGLRRRRGVHGSEWICSWHGCFVCWGLPVTARLMPRSFLFSFYLHLLRKKFCRFWYFLLSLLPFR